MQYKVNSKINVTNVIRLLTVCLGISFIILSLYGYFKIIPQHQLQAIKDDQQIIINIADKIVKTNNIPSNTVSQLEDSTNNIDTIDTHTNANTNSLTQSSDTSVAQSDHHMLPNQDLDLINQNSKDLDAKIPVLKEEHNKYLPPKTKIAILLTGLGLNKIITELALNLPNSVGIGISPYTNELKPLILGAKNAGYEIFTELPFETNNYPLDDVGPLGLLTTNDTNENSTRLTKVLTALPNINGLYSLPNEVFSENIQNIDPLLDILSHNHLLLYSRANTAATFSSICKKRSIFCACCDIYIDLNTDTALLEQSFERLEEISRMNGKAIGFINAYPLTINTLIKWLNTLEKKNIQLIPLTTLIHD